jgi:hypothetical protein
MALPCLYWKLFIDVLGNCEILTKLWKLTVTYFIACFLMKKEKLNITTPPNCLRGLLKTDIFPSLMCVTRRLRVIWEMTTLPLLVIMLVDGIESDRLCDTNSRAQWKSVTNYEASKGVWPVFIVILSDLCIDIACTILHHLAYHCQNVRP